jgi:GntR family transcriptional repressor for pyruvate dehydrogenase complex
MSAPAALAERTDLFAPVQREATLATRVARRIEDMIVERRLQPGERLPTERELARQLDVSRTVIREAVAALIAKDLLETAPSGGIVVRTPSAETVAESMALFLRTREAHFGYDRVGEVRRVLEVAIAGLAAERRTDDDLQVMERYLVEAEDADSDREQYASADVAFHAALASATQNELFRLLLDSVAGIMYQVRATGFDVPGAKARTAAHHRAILEQVRNSNADGARQAMLDHLSEAEETQRKVGPDMVFGPQ